MGSKSRLRWLRRVLELSLYSPRDDSIEFAAEIVESIFRKMLALHRGLRSLERWRVTLFVDPPMLGDLLIG